MQALAIVELHISAKDAPEVGDGREGPAVCHLGFQRVEERFHVGVLIRRAPTRHALLDAALGQTVAKRRPQKLAATVAVKNEARLRLSPAQRGMHDGAREGGITRRRHPPREDPARVLIQNRREVPIPVGNLEIGQVADPDLIGRARLRATHAIGMLAEPPMSTGRPTIHTNGAGAPPTHAHQAFDPSMTQAMTARRERLIEARAAIGPAAVLEDCTHLFEEYPVLSRVRTRRPVAPGIEARSRDREEPTETRHSEGFAFLLDEREDRGFRAEVNRMSFFSNACSSVSNACDRWSA